MLEIVLKELHRNQQTVKDSKTRFKVLDAGRRFGKNILEHNIAVEAILQGKPVGWGSPTYKNLADDWRELVSILAPITSHKSEQERRIECVTGGVLEMWSLDNPGQIRGRSYGLWIINEAAHVPYLMDIWQTIIRATLVDLKGEAFFGSTPNGINDFHTLYNTEGKEWESWHFTSYDNPFLDPSELDSIRASISEREWRQEYMAEFLESEGAVFRNIEACVLAPKTKPEDHKGHTVVGGIDWGKENDWTVLSVGCVNCRREIHLDRFNQIDYYLQIGRLEHLHKVWDVARWKVEVNSIGTPLFEQMQRMGLPIIAFMTTIQSKTALMEGLALAMERGEAQFLAHAAGRAEFAAMERRVTATGLSTYSAPDGMHDDIVIARALMWQLLSETHVRDRERYKSLRKGWEGMRKIL